jgi:hypothetical protein
MKSAKLFLAILISTICSVTLSVPNVFAGANYPKNHQSKFELKLPAVSNYVEYHEIEGVIWVFIFGDDGKIIECYPLD